MTYFAVQHIDGGVIITVTEHRFGYQLAIANPNGGTIVAFYSDDVDYAIDRAVDMIADDI